jgi:EF-hand domain pair
MYRGWSYSTAAKDFCQETCMVNAGFRLSAAGALQHEWLSPRRKEHSFRTLPNELVVSFNLFRIAPPLKQIALNALARTIKSSKYRVVFEELNKSHSGVLSKEEFMDGFKDSGMSGDEKNDLFDKLDINCNDVIMYTEFIAGTLEAEGELEEAQLREAFDMISTNGRYITKKNVADIVSESLKGQSEIKVIKTRFEVIMNKFSKSHKKDKVHYEDFAKMFEHGFDATRSIDAIVEFSLNEEQLNCMKEDDRIKHMEAIKEAED